MIVVWGPSTDDPIAAVHDALVDRGVDLVHIDAADLDTMEFDVEIATTPTGWMSVTGRRIELDQIHGVYLRPATPPLGRARDASAMLTTVSAALRAVVVNRPWAGRSNWSKPTQVRAIASYGIGVPDTVVTTDRDIARRFLDRHGCVVYKSISGIRSIVAAIDATDPGRLDDIGHGPVQFQQWVPGVDVRVHVVGRQWFATRIESEGIDYRYAALDGHLPVMTATEIPDGLGLDLVDLTRSMGLAVSGIDLRMTPDDWWCLEVNPSPGFTFYEGHTGQPITAAVADLLVAPDDDIGLTPTVGGGGHRPEELDR